jgi:hypothetical protein
MMILSKLPGVKEDISREELLQNLKRYGGGIVRTITVNCLVLMMNASFLLPLPLLVLRAGVFPETNSSLC